MAIGFCKNCEQKYSRPESKLGLFCSKQCYGRSKKGGVPWNKGKKTGVSPWLGKNRSEETITKIKAALTGRKHTLESRRKMSISSFGNKSTLGRREKEANNWKGGRTQKSKIGRSTKKYNEWRQSIFERDNFTCQKCWKRGLEINAHHVINYKPQETSKNDLGITLCRKCHYGYHLMFGYTKNNQQELLTYLLL